MNYRLEAQTFKCSARANIRLDLGCTLLYR
jgi:hypothetical protein